MFKCSLSGGDSVEGALVAVDPVSKVVVLGEWRTVSQAAAGTSQCST